MEKTKPRLIQDLGVECINTRRDRYGLYECPYCKKEFKSKATNIKTGKISGCGCRIGNHL